MLRNPHASLPKSPNSILQTRQKFKEAYDIHTAAVIERAEKQIYLARHGRRLLNLLDDTPVVPGDTRPAFEGASQGRQILNDGEEDLRDWTPIMEPITSSSGQMTSNLMPTQASTVAPSETGEAPSIGPEGSAIGGSPHTATTA